MTLPFDTTVLEALYAVRDVSTTLLFIDVSELGQWYTIYGLATVAALYLALHKRFALAQGLLLSVITSGIATFLLKSFIARPRPPAEFWAYAESWYSFPSAHAALSLACYGFFAYIIIRLSSKKSIRWIALTFFTALVLIIGFSRLYLGIHYPSDVLAGYALGAACLSLGIWSERTLSRDRVGV